MAIARKFGEKVYKWHVPDVQSAAIGFAFASDSFAILVISLS